MFNEKTAKILSFILSATLIFTSLPLVGMAAIDSGGDWEYEILPDGTAKITKYVGFDFVTE